MITQDEHVAIVKRYSATVSFADTGCQDLIFWPNLPRDTVSKVSELAKKRGISYQEALRITLLKTVGEEIPRVTSAPHDGDAILPPEQVAAFRNAVREARVFEVPTATFGAIMEAARQEAQRDLIATLERFVGRGVSREAVDMMTKIALGEEVDLSEPGHVEATAGVRRAVMELDTDDFPGDELPFPSCMFMVTDPPKIDPGIARVMQKKVSFRGRDLRCYGLIVSKQFCALHLGAEEEAVYIDFRPLVFWTGGKWEFIAGAGFGKRLVEAFIRLINEFKQVIEQRRGIGEQLMMKKLRKQGALSMAVPPPFYVVNLSDSFIREKKASIFPPRPRDWKHRWDVRGHSSIRVARGALGTLTEKERADLTKRGYKIFEGADPDPVLVAELGRRHMPPKRVDEWMAVLCTWKTAYIKGPKDKPYVPAAHRVPERRAP